jgi:hypothetical protein
MDVLVSTLPAALNFVAAVVRARPGKPAKARLPNVLLPAGVERPRRSRWWRVKQAFRRRRRRR